MGSNAFLLSVVYLAFGITVEAGRRFLPASALGQLATRASLILDALPMRILDAVGALEPLRERYLSGRLPEEALRLAFSLTTIALIFALAVGTGLALAGLRRVALRRMG